jgi:hypothetical protein
MLQEQDKDIVAALSDVEATVHADPSQGRYQYSSLQVHE